MAAFGILAALRSGVGASSSTSRWPTARCRCWRCRPRACSRAATCRGAASSCWAGGCSVTGPIACADGWVSMGALEPKFWAAFCRGVGREDLLRTSSTRPGSRAHREVEAVIFGAHARRVGGVQRRARLLPGAGARARRGRCRTSMSLARGMVATGCWRRRCACPRRRPTTRAAARRGWASTPTRCSARRATTRVRDRRAARVGGGEVSAEALLRPRSATGATGRPSARRGRGTRATSTPGRRRALLTGLLERTAPRDDMVLARVTVEILGAVPIAEVEVVDVGRAARTVGRAARGRAAGGRARGAARAGVAGPGVAGRDAARRRRSRCPEDADPPPPQLGETFGYAHAVEWRWAGGGWTERGPGDGLDAHADPASSRARSRRRASA